MILVLSDVEYLVMMLGTTSAWLMKVNGRRWLLIDFPLVLSSVDGASKSPSGDGFACS